LSAVHSTQSAFDETLSYSRYHPSKGYSWDFKEKNLKYNVGKKESTKEEMSSLFQRQRVDLLLGELTRKFPIKPPPPQATAAPEQSNKPSSTGGFEAVIIELETAFQFYTRTN
jgi:mediator of RNA polymerase II transcription subunit 6